MAPTPSTMLPLGTRAPAFSLPEVSGGTVSLDDFKGSKALLVIFLCKHCPYVVHVRDELARIARDYKDRGVGVLGISSNDAAKYPDDAPAQLAAMKTEARLGFPIGYDESQDVARAYTAACTPDLFLFDGNYQLVYRGQLDDSRPGRGEADGRDLRSALDALLSGQPLPPDQKPSTGCNIKWKPGNEPNY